MENKKILEHSLLNSLGVFIYVLAIALFFNNANKIFGNTPSFWAPLAMLLLFIVSATITGLLVFGRPIWLYLGGQKKEALKMLFYTVGWLTLITVMAFIALAVIK